MFYLILYLFIEILVSVEIAGRIGGLMTFFEVIVSAVIGFFLLTNFRYTLAQSMNALMSGTMSVQEFQRLSLFTLLGAILLIIPGFFSDLLGILFQFSFFGTLFATKVLDLKNSNTSKKHYREDKHDAIDVEVIDSDDSK